MRNTGTLLALLTLTVVTSGCCQTCRNFFRRGAPCGTATLAPPMMGAPRPLGSPYVSVPPQPVQSIVPPTLVPQQGFGCQPAVPCCQPCQPCCEPCPTQCCDPCQTNCVPMGSGYMGPECGCVGEQVGEGEWFGGYVNENESRDTYVPQGSGRLPNDPGPKGTQ